MPRRWRSTRPARRARGATVYVTLEPCAHDSARGPACADLLVEAAPARVVIAARRPRSAHRRRSASSGCEAAGIAVETGLCRAEAERSMAGFFSRIRLGRPFVTLKLAMSIDGRIALAVGREPMDHRRGSARPCPSRARPDRHDPGRPRHLRGRRAAARRAAAGARGPLAAPGAADPRRRRSRAGRGSAAPQAMYAAWTTSTTCWSRAARRPPPPSSPPTWSTGCSSTAPRS